MNLSNCTNKINPKMIPKTPKCEKKYNHLFMLVFMVAALVFSMLLISGCNNLNEFEQSREMMGTYITINLFADDRDAAREAFDIAFDAIGKVEDKFTIYENTSETSVLNREGQINASDEFIYVLQEGLYYSELTEGSFDITVQPILDLYSESFDNRGRPPTPDEISKTLQLVNYSKIIVNNSHVQLENKSMGLTFGGIAKGYAVDKAIEELKKYGIESALINAGGDLYALGEKNNNQWRMAVKDPDGGFLMNFQIKDMAVATSGNYERYFDESKSFHHIVNPKTGYSANETISVTVKAKTALEADALATGIFVMGAEDGLQLINSLDKTEAIIIDSDRNIHHSSGFKE